MKNKQWQSPIKVYCKQCQEWIDESKTTFINIEEDMQGRDRLMFICPNCDTENTSLRRS